MAELNYGTIDEKWNATDFHTKTIHALQDDQDLETLTTQMTTTHAEEIRLPIKRPARGIGRGPGEGRSGAAASRLAKISSLWTDDNSDNVYIDLRERIASDIRTKAQVAQAQNTDMHAAIARDQKKYHIRQKNEIIIGGMAKEGEHYTGKASNAPLAATDAVNFNMSEVFATRARLVKNFAADGEVICYLSPDIFAKALAQIQFTSGDFGPKTLMGFRRMLDLAGVTFVEVAAMDAYAPTNVTFSGKSFALWYKKDCVISLKNPMGIGSHVVFNDEYYAYTYSSSILFGSGVALRDGVIGRVYNIVDAT